MFCSALGVLHLAFVVATCCCFLKRPCFNMYSLSMYLLCYMGNYVFFYMALFNLSVIQSMCTQCSRYNQNNSIIYLAFAHEES